MKRALGLALVLGALGQAGLVHAGAVAVRTFEPAIPFNWASTVKAPLVAGAFAMNSAADDLNKQKSSPPSKQETAPPPKQDTNQDADNAAREKAREQEKKDKEDRKH